MMIQTLMGTMFQDRLQLLLSEQDQRVDLEHLEPLGKH